MGAFRHRELPCQQQNTGKFLIPLPPPNATLKELGLDIQGVESYVPADKTFCVYLARDEEIIREHARRSGFPANKITEVRRMIDPTTATAS